MRAAFSKSPDCATFVALQALGRAGGAGGVGRQAGCTVTEPPLAGCAGRASSVRGGERAGVLPTTGPTRHARAHQRDSGGDAHHPRTGAGLHAVFGTVIRKGKTPSITFSAADAELPFLSANDAMWQVFEPDLRRRLTELDESSSIGERVRGLLLESLPSGQASMDAAAGRLATNKRRVQHRLGEEGVTFQSVVNATREELARHYLTADYGVQRRDRLSARIRGSELVLQGVPRLDRGHACRARAR